MAYYGVEGLRPGDYRCHEPAIRVSEGSIADLECGLTYAAPDGVTGEYESAKADHGAGERGVRPQPHGEFSVHVDAGRSTIHQFYMDEFLNAFWPNLASTVLGLIFGLPIALWTNRRIVAHAEGQKEREDKAALLHTLDVISRALEFNRTRLEHVLDTISGGTVPFDTALDCSAWDASKDGFNPTLTDPQLRQALAYHFSRMQAIARLNEVYLNQFIGIASALQGSKDNREGLKKYLVLVISDLTVATDDLIQQLTSARNGLLTGTSSRVASIQSGLSFAAPDAAVSDA